VTATPQHLKALEFANHVRLKRAAIRRDITAGRVSPIELLEGEIPPELKAMTLGKFLRAMKSWGPTKVDRLLGYCALDDKRTLGSLSERQRRLIALELRRIHGNTNKKAA
jgi:hypothetical protein